MNRPLNNMIGSKVQGIVNFKDYWQVNTDKFSLNIYNPFKYELYGNKAVNIDDENKSIFINCILTDVIYEERKRLVIELDKTKRLLISLLDCDYTAPEAISLHYVSGEIIVL